MMTRLHVSSVETEALAMALDEVVPWSTCSKVLNHSGWLDVLEVIKNQSPAAYSELKKTYAERMQRHLEARGWL